MPKSMIEKICRQKGAVFFSGCTKEDIRKLNKSLSEHNFCQLPEECVEVLQISNGLVFDGFEILGTKSHRRHQKNYILNSILDINKKYSKFEFFSHKLILGELPESFVIYDSEAGNYEITDRLNLDSKMICNSLSELLKTIIQFLVIKE